VEETERRDTANLLVYCAVVAAEAPRTRHVFLTAGRVTSSTWERLLVKTVKLKDAEKCQRGLENAVKWCKLVLSDKKLYESMKFNIKYYFRTEIFFLSIQLYNCLANNSWNRHHLIDIKYSSRALNIQIYNLRNKNYVFKFFSF